MRAASDRAKAAELAIVLSAWQALTQAGWFRQLSLLLLAGRALVHGVRMALTCHVELYGSHPMWRKASCSWAAGPALPD